jgi:hypothetical protein
MWKKLEHQAKEEKKLIFYSVRYFSMMAYQAFRFR